MYETSVCDGDKVGLRQLQASGLGDQWWNLPCGGQVQRCKDSQERYSCDSHAGRWVRMTSRDANAPSVTVYNNAVCAECRPGQRKCLGELRSGYSKCSEHYQWRIGCMGRGGYNAQHFFTVFIAHSLLCHSRHALIHVHTRSRTNCFLCIA